MDSRRRTSLLLLAAVLVGILTLWQFEPRVALLWLNTARLAGGACLVGLPLGTLAAAILYKTNAPGRKPAELFFIGMLFVPLYLVAGAWNAGFGLQGWYTLATNRHGVGEPLLSGWRAAIWVHGLAAVPWVAVIVGAALRAAEPEIEEDAATCASPARVLMHVSLRHAAPALIVAALWIALVASAEISATDFFQVRTFGEEVYTQASLGTFDFSGLQVGAPGAARSVLSASGLWIGLALSTALAGAAIAAARGWLTSFVGATHRAPWIARLGGWRWPAAFALWLILLLVAGVPLANLLYKLGMQGELTPLGPVRSWSVMKAAQRLAAAPAEFRGDLWLSIRVAALASTAALLMAVPLAWSMRNARRVPWLRLAVLALCLTVPGPLLGVALIHIMNRPADSALAWLGWLYDTNFAPWLVQTIRALPLATLILWPALASVPQSMLDLAATEGSGSWSRLVRVALPQRLPAVAGAWLIGLAIAIGELAASVLVVPPQRSTLISVRIFQLLHYGIDDRVAAISFVMVATVAALTAAAAALVGRRL